MKISIARSVNQKTKFLSWFSGAPKYVLFVFDQTQFLLRVASFPAGIFRKLNILEASDRFGNRFLHRDAFSR
jgi:hypothetical protein